VTLIKTVIPYGLVGYLSSHQVNMATHNLRLGTNMIVVIQINDTKPSKHNLFISVNNENMTTPHQHVLTLYMSSSWGKHIYELGVVTLQVGKSFPPNDNHI
jgi:hypothetical protein